MNPCKSYHYYTQYYNNYYCNSVIIINKYSLIISIFQIPVLWIHFINSSFLSTYQNSKQKVNHFETKYIVWHLYFEKNACLIMISCFWWSNFLITLNNIKYLTSLIVSAQLKIFFFYNYFWYTFYAEFYHKLSTGN